MPGAYAATSSPGAHHSAHATMSRQEPPSSLAVNGETPPKHDSSVVSRSGRSREDLLARQKEREARSLELEKAYVHDVYDQISGHFSDARYRPWPRVRNFLLDLEPGSLVCDVGAGNGKYLNVNPDVFKIGCDRCFPLCEIARQKEHQVIVCDNLALPFRDNSYDACLSIAVIHHFTTTERRVRALRELARILRIGGRILISVWAMEQRHRKFEAQDVLVPWRKIESDHSSSDDKPPIDVQPTSSAARDPIDGPDVVTTQPGPHQAPCSPSPVLQPGPSGSGLLHQGSDLAEGAAGLRAPEPSAMPSSVTPTTSEDEMVHAYHAHTHTSDSDSCHNTTVQRGFFGGSRKRIRVRANPLSGVGEAAAGCSDVGRGTQDMDAHAHVGLPGAHSSSQSSSDLSSPSETCYGFVRRALQKLAGSGRVPHRKPWFFQNMSASREELNFEHLRHHQEALAAMGWDNPHQWRRAADLCNEANNDGDEFDDDPLGDNAPIELQCMDGGEDAAGDSNNSNGGSNTKQRKYKLPSSSGEGLFSAYASFSAAASSLLSRRGFSMPSQRTSTIISDKGDQDSKSRSLSDLITSVLPLGSLIRARTNKMRAQMAKGTQRSSTPGTSTDRHHGRSGTTTVVGHEQTVPSPGESATVVHQPCTDAPGNTEPAGCQEPITAAISEPVGAIPAESQLLRSSSLSLRSNTSSNMDANSSGAHSSANDEPRAAGSALLGLGMNVDAIYRRDAFSRKQFSLTIPAPSVCKDTKSDIELNRRGRALHSRSLQKAVSFSGYSAHRPESPFNDTPRSSAEGSRGTLNASTDKVCEEDPTSQQLDASGARSSFSSMEEATIKETTVAGRMQTEDDNENNAEESLRHPLSPPDFCLNIQDQADSEPARDDDETNSTSSSATVIQLSQGGLRPAASGPQHLRPRPFLIKQKKSICEDDGVSFDNPGNDRGQPKNVTRPVMRASSFPSEKCPGPKGPGARPPRTGTEFQVRQFPLSSTGSSLLKQRSLNEELLVPPKPRVKERLPKQTSLNESLLYRTQHKEKESEKKDFFQCFQRLHTLKEEIRSRGPSFDKTSQKCQERAESVQSTLRNGFARILQSWRSENRWQSTSMPMYRPQMFHSSSVSASNPTASGSGGANVSESVRRGLWYGFHPRTGNLASKIIWERSPTPKSPLHKGPGGGTFFPADSPDLTFRRRFSSGDYSSGDSCVTPTVCATANKCADCSTSMRQISGTYETVMIDDHHIIMRERKLSKEENSDSSSKENSFQSDTSVDSEDSFVSVIFIPKPENQTLGGAVHPGANGDLISAGPGSPALDPFHRSLSSDSPSDPQMSPKSPCSPLSPRSPNGQNSRQNAGGSRFFGPKFQHGPAGVRIHTAHSFTTVNNGSKSQAQRLPTHSTIGEIPCATLSSVSIQLNAGEEEAPPDTSDKKTSKDASALGGDLNSSELHSSASLERLMKQAQKHKELERLRRDAAALSARIQARISKFQESHPPPSPLFPSSFPSFAPKHTPGSLLGFPEAVGNKEGTQESNDSSSDQEVKPTAEPDAKDSPSKETPQEHPDSPNAAGAHASSHHSSPVVEEAPSSETKPKDELVKVDLPKASGHQKQQISCLAKGENVEIIRKQDSYGIVKVQAVRRTPVAGVDGEGQTFTMQLLEASTANVFNPELDDMDSDLTDELTEITEPETSSSYGSNTSMLNDDEWPPRDLDNILEAGIESDERYGEESDRDSESWDCLVRRSARDRGSFGYQSSTDGSSVGGGMPPYGGYASAFKDSSRSDEDTSSLTGVSSLSHSRYGDSSCDSDNWSGGFSDRTSVDSAFRPWKITEEYLMSRRGTAASRWESFESTSSSETSGSGHRPSIGGGRPGLYSRRSSSQRTSAQMMGFPSFSEDEEGFVPGGAGAFMRGVRFYHDSSIEEENDFDCAGAGEEEGSALKSAKNLSDYSDLLVAASLKQAYAIIARNQARQRALMRAQASRRASSQLVNKRRDSKQLAGRHPRSSFSCWLNAAASRAAAATGEPSGVFIDRYNPPGAPPLTRTRRSIAGGKSFEFSKDISGSAPTKLEAHRRSKKFSLPSTVLQVGLTVAPVPMSRQDSDASSSASGNAANQAPDGACNDESKTRTDPDGQEAEPTIQNENIGAASSPTVKMRYSSGGSGNHRLSPRVGSTSDGRQSWDTTSVSTSQDSLQSSDNGGSHSANFHRYYHVFRERELDKLIEKYVQNLHIISSYYDHANWCIIAEKVQVWTI